MILNFSFRYERRAHLLVTFPLVPRIHLALLLLLVFHLPELAMSGAERNLGLKGQVDRD